MSKPTVKLEIVATGHRLNAEDSLLIVISPQWAEYSEGILDALEDLTGHRRHAILDIPKEDIKIFSVRQPVTVSIEQLRPILPKDEEQR